MPPDALARRFAAGLEVYRERLAAAFPDLWQRVVAQAASPAPVTRLWSVYNEGYLLRGPGEGAPLLGIDLVPPRQAGDAAARAMLEALPRIPLLLITHRHGDHLDPVVVERLLEAGATVALPADAWEALRERTGLQEPPPNVRLVRAGDRFEAAGVAVAAHASDHLSEKVAESMAYDVLAGGVRVLHAADHRAFAAPVATWPRGVDLLILSVYHPELDVAEQAGALERMKDMPDDAAWAARFDLDEKAALGAFAERLAPSRLLLGHLYELGHEPEKLWRFVDTGIVKEALFARVPHMSVHALAPGECLPLLPAPY